MREPYALTLADGTRFDLRYTFKSIRHFEKLTGGNFFGDSANGRIGADYLAAGLAAGLLWQNPKIAIDAIDTAIEKHLDAGGDLPSLMNSLMEALQKSGVLRGGVEDRPTKPAEDAGQ